MSKARSSSNADLTAQARSPASSSMQLQQQQQPVGGGSTQLAQRDTPLLQQQQSVKSSATKAATPFNSQTPSSQQSQSQPPLHPVHACPGPDLFDEWWSGDDLSSDDDDDCEAPALLTPPLIPPFRFALVECSRPASVGGAQSHSSGSNSALQGSPANASSSQAQMQPAGSGVGSPHPQQLKSIKSTASLSSLSTVSSSSSVASLAGSAAPSPSHAAGAAGPPLGRRASLNNSTPINPAMLSNAAAQRTTPQQQQQQQQAQSAQPNAASASGSVSATAGALVLPLTSPPTSPSRVFGPSASAAAFAASAAAAGSVAQSAPPQLTPAMASAAHIGKHTCMRGLSDHSVYRGSYPTLKNMHFLSRLQLRSIISLTPEPPSADLKKFCRDGGFDPAVVGGASSSGAAAAAAGSASIAAISSSAVPAAAATAAPSPTPIRLYHFPVPKWNPEKDGDIVSVSSAQMVQIVGLLINSANLPLYVHCIDGCNTTALVIACLRKLQCWSMLSIVQEFLRFTREPGGITDAEKSFLDRFNHHGLGGGSSAGTAGMAVGSNAGGGVGGANSAASDVAASSKIAPVTGPNILLRIPASLPNWLWGGMHLAVHPLGIRIYDAHVPAFAALHAKQLAPIDSTTANTVPPTPASVAASAALAAHAGWRLLPALDGSDRPAPDPLATAVTSSSSVAAPSAPDLPPLLHLDGDGSLWDGLQLVEPLSPVSAAGLLAGAIPETDKERKKRKKKEKEAEKKNKDAAVTTSASAAATTITAATVAVGCCSGQPLDVPPDDSVVSSSPDFPTVLKKVPSADGGSKPKGAASKPEGSTAATAVPPALPPSTHASRSPTPASASVTAGLTAAGSDSTAPTAASAAPLVTAAATPTPTAAPAVTTAPAVPLPAAAAPASAPSLLSHPGEFHSLADLEASQWGKTRSSLAAEMLFHAASFEMPGAPLANGGAAGDDGSGGGACVAPSSSNPVLPPRDLSLWPEDQFIEHPDDPDLTLTRDEFDTDVSLLLASLALEGFTMNHKIARPMQLCHSDQGEA